MNMSQRILGPVLVVLGGLTHGTQPVARTLVANPARTAQETPRFVWTGRVRTADGALREESLGAEHGARLSKEIAAIRVKINVDRKLDEARADLVDLSIRASRGGYAERNQVLIDLVLAEIELAAANGVPTRAPYVLFTPLPTSRDSSYYELAPASEADCKLARDVLGDPRVVQAQTALADVRGTTTAAFAGEDKVTAIVEDALQRGDVSLSASLGERAVPVLVARIEASLEDFPPRVRDPLDHLTIIHGGRAAELVAKNYAKGGPIWKARVLRLMNGAGVFEAHTPGAPLTMPTWSEVRDNSERPTYAFPRWFDVLELLLSDPSTRREAVQLVPELPMRDALTPGIQQALATILMDPVSPLADDVLSALRGGRGRPTTQVLLENVLTSPNAKVRAFAAAQLASCERSDALLAAERSPDPVVRRAVASSLRSRYVAVASYPIASKSDRKEPRLGEPERGILTRLAQDADAGVRMEAATSIAELATPLESAVYERLARDPESRVRVAVLEAQALPLEQRATLALGLASDTDVTVLRQLDDVLRAINMMPATRPYPECFLPVLRARRANRVLDVERGEINWSDWYERMSLTDSGLAVLLEWSSEPGGESPCRVLGDRLRELANGREGLGPRAGADTWVRAYRESLGLAHSDTPVHIVRYLVREGHEQIPEFRAVAEDASLSALGRCGALAIGANSGAPGIVDTCLAILRAASPISDDVRKSYAQFLWFLVQPLADADRARLADALLASNALDPGLTAELLASIARLTPLSSAQSDRILERFLDEPTDRSARSVVDRALAEVACRPRERQGDWLVRAAHTGPHVDQAFRLLGDLRDDNYVDILHEGLTGRISISGPAPDVRAAALNALTRYFDQRAADIILEVAGSTPDAEFRDECFKALETIRRYEAERGRVARDRATKEAITTAVKDLITMLDDADASVRVQAVRALATLGAVEQFPAIVRRLKDTDERVRQAAAAALDVLNAPAGSK